MNRRAMLMGIAALLATTTVEASRIGILEEISPLPTTYIQGVTVLDPAPPGIDFTPFADVPEFALGDVTGSVQYVPGLADDPQDFTDAGFVAGNIALIDRGAVTFSSKIRLADDAGAIGVLIATTFPSPIGGLFEGGADGYSFIPALMIRYGLGQDLITRLSAGESIEMRLAVYPDPNAVPEPSTLVLCSLGLIGMLGILRRSGWAA